MYSMDVPGIQMSSTKSRDLNVTIQVSLGNSCSKATILLFSFGLRSVMGEAGKSFWISPARISGKIDKKAKTVPTNNLGISTRVIEGIDAWRNLT